MEESENNRKRHSQWTLFVYCTVIVLLLVYGNLETSRSIYDGPKLVAIERSNPMVRNVVGWSAFLSSLLILVVTLFFSTKGWLRWPAVGILIGLVFYPYCFLRQIGMNLAPWTTHGQVTTDEGATFVFCDSSFLQGQRLAITQEESSGFLTTSYRVLVDTHGDSPRSWASVIRPGGSVDGYGQLYLKNSTLIGVRYDNRCYLAYDLKKKQAYGHGSVESLSPFSCLEGADEANASDIRRTIGRIQEYANFCGKTDDVRHAANWLNGENVPGCPTVESIQDGLTHEKSTVTAAAMQITDAYSDAKDKLRTRVDSYVTEQVDKLDVSTAEERRRACEELGGMGQSASAAIPRLERFVRTEKDNRTRLQASQTLGLIGREARPALIRLAKSNEAWVRSDAFFGLEAAGA
ncbi:MAG: HEAT repeat domain-containing protein, partial [Planctomycetota bacterium]